MARVFPKPKYERDAFYRFILFFGYAEEEYKNWAFAASAGIELPAFNESKSKPTSKETDRMRALDAMYDLGTRNTAQKMISLQRAFQQYGNACMEGVTEVLEGSTAQFHILYAFLSQRIKTRSEKVDYWKLADSDLRTLGTIGMVGSLASPGPAVDACQNFRWYRYLLKNKPHIARLLAVSEVLRMGVSSREVSDATRNFINGIPYFGDKEDLFKVTNRRFVNLMPDEQAWCFMDIMAWKRGNQLFLLDREQRAEVGELLYGIANLAFYALNYRMNTEGKDAWGCYNDVLKYLCESMGHVVKKRLRTDKLARQMKSSYACFLAEYEPSGSSASDYQKELTSWQVPLILEEAQGASQGEELWYHAISHWPDELKVDMGTAWNFIPAPDSRPSAQSESMRKKVNAKKVYSREAVESFLAYSKTVLTAHILVGNNGAEGEWHGHNPAEDPEEYEWVKNCRAGVLDYPTEEKCMGVHLTGCLQWKNHLEWWHFTAKDVTHVHADLSKYATRDAYNKLTREDHNELLHCLVHGPKFSTKYTPEEVRASLEAGKPLGDRVTVTASKRENTKRGVPLEGEVTAKARETQSMDDVGREALTELNQNCPTLARYVDGIASRIGRAGLEMQVDKMLVRAAQGDFLIALDVKGWSPNLLRELEMRFARVIMDFFRGSWGISIEALLDSLHVVMSKLGFHDVWKMLDGSVQGWLPDVDSLLHSMVAQWSLFRTKRAGLLPADVTMAKVVQIDDILMALSPGASSPKVIVQALCEQYRSLGIEPDLIKTLAGVNKGHFLNRLYAAVKKRRFEVLTSSKIAAKADREWTQKFVAANAQIQSVFGSFLGASDRGANPVACYLCALGRAMTLVRSYSLRGDQLKTTVACFAAWQSSGIGGWEFPSFSQWVSRSAATALDHGLGLASRLARTIATTEPLLSDAIFAMMGCLKNKALHLTSYVALADDPFQVRVKGSCDPASIRNSALSKAAKRAIKDRQFVKLNSFSTSGEYESFVARVLKSKRWPAPLIQAWSNTLPHCIMRALTTTAERSEVLIGYLSYKERHKALGELRYANREYFKAWKKVYRLTGMSQEERQEACMVAEELRKRRVTGMDVEMSMLRAPSIEDIVSHLPGDEGGAIRVFMKPCSAKQIYDGPEGCNIKRTSVSSPIVYEAAFEANSWDPMTKKYDALQPVAMCAHALGDKEGVLYRAWHQLYLGEDPGHGLVCDAAMSNNPARMCRKLAKRNHCVMALPNTVSSISVDYSRFLEVFDHGRLLVDPAQVRTVMRASVCLDLALGACTNSHVERHYSVRSNQHVVEGDISIRDRIAFEMPNVRAVLTDNMVNNLKHLISLSRPETDHEAITTAGSGFFKVPGKSRKMTAIEYMDSIPISRVLGALANVKEEQFMSGTDVKVEKKDVDTEQVFAPGSRSPKAAIRFHGKGTSAKQTYAMMELAKLVRWLHKEGLDDNARRKINALISVHGNELKKMGYIQDLSSLQQGFNTKHALRRLFDRTGVDKKHISQTRCDIWNDYADSHRARAMLPDKASDERYRHSFMAAALSSWAISDTRGATYDVAWELCIVAILSDLAAKHRRTGVSIASERVAEAVKGFIGASLTRRGIKRVTALTKVIRGLWDDEIPKDFEGIVQGAVSAIDDLEKYYIGDWVLPQAKEEAATERVKGEGTLAHAARPEEAYSGISGLEDATGTEFAAVSSPDKEDIVARNPTEWVEFMEEMGFDPEDEENKQDEELLEDFSSFLADKGKGHVDT
jgi:hypothetical protein